MFILLDTSLDKLIPFYDHVNELDDKPVLAMDDLDDLTDYTPGGSFHVVDTYQPSSGLSRWSQLLFAKYGVRYFTDSLDENSPIWAGPVPSEDKVRKVSVDAAFAEGRAGLYADFGVNYLGRTKLDPRNIFLLDNKKGNPLHDPAKDPVLEALYASLPEDWWGSCGFVSTANVDKLEAFLNAFPDVIPITWTTGGMAKLKFCGFPDFVHATEPKNDPNYGINIRDRANRLSYKLSLPPGSQDQGEAPTETFNWGI